MMYYFFNHGQGEGGMSDIKISGDNSVNLGVRGGDAHSSFKVSGDGLFVANSPTIKIAAPEPIKHTHDECGGDVFAVALHQEVSVWGFQPTGRVAWMCPACGIFVQQPK